MAKRTKEEALKTRDDIISSAREVFYEKGFSNTTLNDIVQNIGLTRGAFYWHFKDKEEVFISIYDEFMKVADEIIGRTIAKEDADINTIVDFMKESMNLLIEHDEYRITLDLLIFRTELTEKLQVIEEKDNLWVKSILERVSKIVDEYVKKNHLNISLSAEEVAVSMLAMQRGLGLVYTLNTKVFPQSDSHTKIINNYFQNLLVGEKNEK